MRKIRYGSPVIYVDEHGVQHAALVTQTWAEQNVGGEREYNPERASLAINLVFVSGNAAEKDNYGRQTKHETSVVHKSDQSAPGRYWFEQ